MSENFLEKILIFTDGACSGNPGPGGYGSVIVFPDGRVSELGGGMSSTTNNQMEILAVSKALKFIEGEKGDVWVLTDSTYVIRGITQWIWGWKKRGWTTAEGNPVNNIDFWKELERNVLNRKSTGKVEWKYVRGHTNVPGNERCDEIAVSYSKKKFVPLFSGTLLDYSIPIHDIPEDLSLPPMKSSNEPKKKAHSYLSYVNGELKRHKTWPECEAVVKGRRGAKFKKSTSPENEVEIIKEWGLSPGKLPRS